MKKGVRLDFIKGSATVYQPRKRVFNHQYQGITVAVPAPEIAGFRGKKPDLA